MLETELPNLGLGWEATVGETPETVLSKERNRACRSKGKGSLYSARAKGREISKLIFDSPLLTRAELT